MTPFTALYRKERRRQLAPLALALVFVAAILLMPVAYLEARMGLAFYLVVFYVTATAAFSYAGEDEEKTALFLRRMPVSGGTILRAKLAWLGTTLAVLLVPLGIAGAVCVAGSLVLFVPDALAGDQATFSYYFWGDLGMSALYATVTLFCTVSWALFWTTRWPSKLYATLLAFLSAIGSAFLASFLSMFVVAFVTATTNLLPETEITVNRAILGGVFLASIFVTTISLRRAARYYAMPERQTEPGYFAPATNEKSLQKPPRLLTRLYSRLFPAGHWRPFAAMLWQSVCQSQSVLLLGLTTALLFSGWQCFFGKEFLEISQRNPDSYAEGVFQGLSVMLLLAGTMIAFGFASAVFMQDQENRGYRALSHRGISPRLVWWSRILPFAAVYLIPLPFLIRFYYDLAVLEGTPPDWIHWGPNLLGLVAVMYLAPFCLGAYASLSHRHLLWSVLKTFGLWCVLLVAVMILIQEKIPVPNLSLGSILLGFLVASRLTVADWLAERSFFRNAWKPALGMGICAGLGAVILFCPAF